MTKPGPNNPARGLHSFGLADILLYHLAARQVPKSLFFQRVRRVGKGPSSRKIFRGSKLWRKLGSRERIRQAARRFFGYLSRFCRRSRRFLALYRLPYAMLWIGPRCPDRRALWRSPFSGLAVALAKPGGAAHNGGFQADAPGGGI